MCYCDGFPFLSVVLGSEDQEEAQGGGSLLGQVQTQRGPVLPPVHPRKSGKGECVRAVAPGGPHEIRNSFLHCCFIY